MVTAKRKIVLSTLDKNLLDAFLMGPNLMKATGHTLYSRHGFLYGFDSCEVIGYYVDGKFHIEQPSLRNDIYCLQKQIIQYLLDKKIEFIAD